MSVIWLALLGLAWAGDGTVQGYAFNADGGAPLAGVHVTAPGVDTVTDARGSFEVTLPEGSHELVLHSARGVTWTVPVRVVEGRETELLLTLDPLSQQVHAQEEAPEQAEVVVVPIDVATGTIAGVVRDGDHGGPVPGARIFVRGLGSEARTDEQGRFELVVPIGSWELALFRSGYSTQSVFDVAVTTGEATPLDLTLVKSGLELVEFVISAPSVKGGTGALLDERRSTGSVSDMLGAEQMSRSGDSDAAGALKRVTGLTVVGGKFVYVRGLGERYSATRMNGATLPSPEPERRVVPLDMIPTGVLESVVVQKTYSPDMPGEFGGGVVNLRTSSVPTEPVLKFGLTMGYDSNTTLRPGWHGPSGPTDFLGIDGGYRDLPDLVREASDGSPLEESDRFSDRGYTPSELEQFGEAMPNRWGMDQQVAPPNFGFAATMGDGTDRGDWALGAVASLLYGIGWDTDRYNRKYYLLGADNQLEPGHDYDFDETMQDVQLGGLLHLGAEMPGRHRFEYTAMVTRSTESLSRYYEGYNRDLNGTLRIGRTRWVERMLVVNQIAGQNQVPGSVIVDWRYTFSWATRGEPDRRDWRLDYEEGTDRWLLSDRPEGNQIFYSGLQDYTHDVGVDVSLPFGGQRSEPGASLFKVGAAYVDRDRGVDTRRYKYFHKGPDSRDNDTLAKPIEDIFNNDTIGPNGFQFEEFTRQTDNYVASQEIAGAYGMIDLGLPSHTRIVGGARVEYGKQRVETYELFNPNQTPVVAELKNTDFLPAVLVTQKLPANMQIRAGYGRTISRPDFRELSPATFNDVTGGRQVYGNPDLKRATIDNVDLRWEWYPNGGESLSVGGFYKRFTDPIENIIVVSAQQSSTFANADGADNLGVELDFRKDFAFVTPALSDLYLAVNASWIHSRVRIGEDSGGIQTSNERPLQGTSPWIYNAQLGYTHPVHQLSLTVSYNVFGPRIVEAGALGAPDTMELPVHQLDFVAFGPIAKGFTWKLKLGNLLNSKVRYTLGDEVVESRREGFNASVGIGWSL